MSKEVFEQSLDEILEFDAGLDINSILESAPAIESDPGKKPDEDKTKVEDKKTTPTLNDINDVLENKVKDDEEDDESIIPDKKTKTDGKASASISNDTNDTSDASFTVIFARDLVAQGLLSSFDESKFLEDSKTLGEAGALRNLIKEEVDANITAAQSDLDAGYQEYLRLTGKGVSQDTAVNLVDLKNKFEGIKVEELTKEENSSLRKQIMVDYFKLTTSMPDNKIEKLVQSSIDMGDDIEDSKEYLTTLKTLIKEQITAEEQEATNRQKLIEDENKRSIELLKENINSLNEIIPGMPINKQTKVQMFEAITKPVKDGKGRTTNAIWALRSEDPMFFDERLAYLFATGYFAKGKTWDKVVNTKTTKTITELEKAIDSKKNTGSSVGRSVMQGQQLDPTVKSNIDAMRGIFGK